MCDFALQDKIIWSIEKYIHVTSNKNKLSFIYTNCINTKNNFVYLLTGFGFCCTATATFFCLF